MIIFMPDSLPPGVGHPQGMAQNSLNFFAWVNLLSAKGLGEKPARAGENNFQ
jgi:hypothetical protein